MKSFLIKWLFLLYVVLLHFLTVLNIEATFPVYADLLKLAASSFYFLAYAMAYSQINRLLGTRW